MDRRRFLLTSLAGALAAPLAVQARQVGKVYRIGLLAGPHPPVLLHEASAVLQALGYVEGKNVAFERKVAAGTDRQLSADAAALVQQKVDVILASGLPATRTAAEATKTTPIVMLVEVDPVAAGLISSFARPGGNVTGLALGTAELTAKRLELLTEAVSGLVRVGFLWNPDNPESVEHWRAAQQAARMTGLELRSFEVRTGHEIEPLFEATVREQCGALAVSDDYVTRARMLRIVTLARANRIPIMYTQSVWVTNFGGLVSYGVNVHQLRPAALYVDKILRGAKPAELPVERPTKFELIINLKTARALGLTIPPSLLARADQVIE